MLIPFEKLVRRYGILPRGVLHLGAHLAEEAQEYKRFGVERVLWVEANPELIERIRLTVEPLGHRVHQAVLASESGREVEFKVTSDGQSSSCLRRGTHEAHYPKIEVVRTLALKTATVADIYRAEGLHEDEFDFVNLDLQGSELDALLGMGSLLDNFQTVYTEVNREAVYEGCPLISELDRYLEERGLSRRAVRWNKAGWGDALYTREKTKGWLARALGDTSKH